MHLQLLYKDTIFPIYQISCILIVTRQFTESQLDLEHFILTLCSFLRFDLVEDRLFGNHYFKGKIILIFTAHVVKSTQPALYHYNIIFFIMIHGQMLKKKKKKKQ